MHTDWSVLLIPGLLGAGFILLLGVLVFLSRFALILPPSSSHIHSTKAEIRRIGIQARRDIRQASDAYQTQLDEILTRKR